MGKFKKVVQFEKEHMPEYQYRFLYKRVLPSFFYILGGAVFVLVWGMVFDFCTNLKVVPYIPLIIWMITTFVLLVLFIIYGKKNTNRLICEKTAEFEKQYHLIARETAIELLEKNRIIINNCLILEADCIPLDDCLIIFHCKTISGVYYFGLGFYSKHNGDNLAYLELDNAVCSYFNQGENAVVNDRLFSLFLFDKRKFMQLLLRYNDEVKMEKHI